MKILNVYTDGSDKNKQHKGNNRLGIGGLVVDNGKMIDNFSMKISPEYLELTYKTTDCSNPTMEMLAVLISLHKFKNLFRKYDKIIFHADYIGVGHWVFTKDWKTKQPYIAQLKDDILEEMNKQNLLGKVDFSWVPGHQNSEKNEDAKWNNVADLLAKGEYNE